MNQSVIKYKAEPALDLSERLMVTIKWNQENEQYVADIEKGVFLPVKARWVDKGHELEGIISETAALRLPVFAQGTFGLDGTTYTFKSGESASSKFSWWVDLPHEWLELEPIITKINTVVERVLAKVADKNESS